MLSASKEKIREFSVSIDSVLRLFNKSIPFLQPTFECLANSIEAGANKITIEFLTDEGLEKTVIGFEITDNGEGFTKKNTDAFFELWTNNKASLGCKGSGRFTWLCVYNNVHIVSTVANEKRKVDIRFHRKFVGDRDYSVLEENVDETRTTIRFEGVTDRYYQAKQGKRLLDKRPFANITDLRQAIIDAFLVPLFLKKESGEGFDIAIKVGDQIEHILPGHIPNLSRKRITIHSAITQDSFEFDLYYRIVHDGRGRISAFYCSGQRPTKEMDKDALGFEGPLPNQASLTALLLSRYLDNAANDARDGFESLVKQKDPDICFPITWNEINRRIRESIREIIAEQVKELEDFNNVQVQKAIEKAPYLSRYIMRNDDTVKNEENLIKCASKRFQKEKDEIGNRFQGLLKDKGIDSAGFVDALTDMSVISATELGAYVHYRQAIIEALRLVSDDQTKKENFIHKIFMPQKTSVLSNEAYSLNNLWLLDDKFMTYAYACSDIEFEKIAKEISSQTGEEFETIKRKRPDMAILFSRDSGRRDGIVIEFKGANATCGEKCKAISELPSNLLAMRDTDCNLNMLWGYIITAFEPAFEQSLRASEFTCHEIGENGHRYWQRYFGSSKAMVYVLDIGTIVGDASERNSTFLSILQGKE